MLLLEMALAFAMTFLLYLLLKRTAGKLYRSYRLWEQLLEEEVLKQEAPKSEAQDKEAPCNEENLNLEEGKKGEGYGQDR